jgi:hypothetical protein
MGIVHHLCGEFAEVAELRMGISCKFFCELNHVLNFSVWSVCSSMINID